MSVSSLSSDDSLAPELSDERPAWTKVPAGPARIKAQLTELENMILQPDRDVFTDKDTTLNFFNVEVWNFSDQKNFLNGLRKMDMTKKKLEKFQKSRYAIYSHFWNYMAEHCREISPEKAMEIINIALRWLLSESVRNLGKAGAKLLKLHCISQRCQDQGVVKQMILDLVDEYAFLVKWESDMGFKKRRNSTLVFFGLLNFTFGLMQLMMNTKDHEKAFNVAHAVVDVSKNCIALDEFDILDKCIQFAEKTFTAIFIDVNKGSAPADAVKNFRLKVLSGYSEPGLSLNILSGFFQLLCAASGITEKTCKGIQSKAFIRLISELCELLNFYGTCSEHESLSLSVSEQCEVVVNFVILIIRILADNVHGRKSGDKSLQVLVTKCTDLLDFVLPKIENRGFINDVHGKLVNSFTELAVEFHNIGDKDQSLEVCQQSINTYYKFAEANNSKADPTQYAMIMADAFHHLKDFMTGLSVIARWMARAPGLMSSQICAYDIYDSKRYNDWGYQWLKYKSDSGDEDTENFTFREALIDVPDYEKFIAASLRLEINVYMTARAALPEALVTAGEHLEDNSDSVYDTAIGILAQVIGFWWGDESTETFCVRSCEELIGVLDEATKDDKENPCLGILAAVTKGWLGFSYLRTLQTKAREDFEFSKANAPEEKPDPSQDVTAIDDRIIPALTSINISHEAEVANNIIFCIDSLYAVIHFDEVEVKCWIDELCPGLIMTTARMCTFQAAAYGDTYNTIRGWHVVERLATMYKRGYIQLFAGMELYRLMPQSLKENVTNLEELQNTGLKLKHMNNSYFARLDYVKSAVCFKNKSYQEGIDWLSKALVLRTHGHNLDAYHLIMAECYLLLAKYIKLPADLSLNFEDISDSLTSLSPTGLIEKAIKLLGGVSRKPNPNSSGWADMYHNNHLLSIIVDTAPDMLQIMIDAGDVKEARTYAADTIYLCQQMCLISRTFQILIPIAENEIVAKTFDSCHVMIDAIDKRLSVEVPPASSRSELVVKELVAQLEKLELPVKNPMRLLRPSPQTWNLIPIDFPEFHYGREGRDEAFKTKAGFIERIYGIPKLLLHSLICHCYVCTNPVISPMVLRFLFLQSKYCRSGAGTTKKALTIISVARVQHQRAMFRVLFHMERMSGRLAHAFSAKRMGRNALESAYLPFFYQSNVISLQTLMELAPAPDMDFIIACYNRLQDGTQNYQDDPPQDDPDSAESVKTKELTSSAVYTSQFTTGKIPAEAPELIEKTRTAGAGDEPEFAELEFECSFKRLDLNDTPEVSIIYQTPPNNSTTPEIIYLDDD